jgi:hypothetical protein
MNSNRIHPNVNGILFSFGFQCFSSLYTCLYDSKKVTPQKNLNLL